MCEDTFTARCLRQLPTYAEGVEHQKTCAMCGWLRSVEHAEAAIIVDELWHEDSANIAAMLWWLRDSDEGLDLDEAIRIVEEPWKWKSEYRRMLAERIVGDRPNE